MASSDTTPDVDSITATFLFPSSKIEHSSDKNFKPDWVEIYIYKESREKLIRNAMNASHMGQKLNITSANPINYWSVH